MHEVCLRSVNVLLSESKADQIDTLLTVQVGGAAVALECAGRELQIRVNLEEQDEEQEEQKEGEDEKLIGEEEGENEEEQEVVCRPKRVQFSPWTPVRGSL